MKRLITALALVLALAPGCDNPQPTPLDAPVSQSIGIDVDGPEVRMLEAARDSIADAYFLRDGKFVCQTRTFDGGSWISIDVATDARGGVITFYIREPGSAWGDSVTCYEGVGATRVVPVGSCTNYEMFDIAIDKAVRAYPWDRADIYGNDNWDQLYLEWGNGWRCFVAIAKPNKPVTSCERPPYMGRRRRPYKTPYLPFETNETGRGEQ